MYTILSQNSVQKLTKISDLHNLKWKLEFMTKQMFFFLRIFTFINNTLQHYINHLETTITIKILCIIIDDFITKINNTGSIQITNGFIVTIMVHSFNLHTLETRRYKYI